MGTLLVVGASSDIGCALINRVSERYDQIIAHYNHWNSGLEEIKYKYPNKIHFVKADLTNKIEIEQMMEDIERKELEPNHVVYLPMNKIYMKHFKKTELSDFETGYRIAVVSAAQIVQALLPKMLLAKSGKFIFVLTAYTVGQPPKYQSAYVTVKYAQLGLMKSLSVEYEEKGITFNAISPDMIQTKFISDLPHLAIERYAENKPSKKILSVHNVIPCLEFLLSSGSDHLTGENILIK